MKTALYTLFVAFVFGSAPISAASSTSLETFHQGAGNIRSMSGCYDVVYRYVENGIVETKPKYRIGHNHYDPFYDALLAQKEEIEVSHSGVEGEEGYTIILAHFGYGGFKRRYHWEEVWTWHPSTETWTQTVSRYKEQRYTNEGAWVLNSWHGIALNSVKPLRDQKFVDHATDYDTLDRDNRLVVGARGWVHSQFNLKVKDNVQVVSTEVGFAEYRRIDDKECSD